MAYGSNIHVALLSTRFFYKEPVYKEPTEKAEIFKELILLKTTSLRNFSI